MFVVASGSIALALACADGVNNTSVHGADSDFVGPTANIQVTPTSAALNQGGQAVLRCAAFDTRGVMLSNAPTWTSSNESVVTVSSDGSVSALGAGGAIVNCEIGGRSAASSITVSTAAVSFVEVTPGAGTVASGDTMRVRGVPRDSFGIQVPGAQVQWASADSSIATVSPSGLVSAKVEGDANILATARGASGAMRIHVMPTAPVPVASVSLSIDDSALRAGQVAHANAQALDANGQNLPDRAITWSASNTAVLSAVTVNATKASIRGISQGVSVLTATSGTTSASVTVTVGSPVVMSVTTSFASPHIIVGQATLASAVPLDGLGHPMTDQPVTWQSLDPSIASVSSGGVVSGNSPGSVVIRATANDGVTGDAAVTVTNAPVASVKTTLGSPTLTAGQTTQASAVPYDVSGNPLTGRSVAWSSLNPSIATVSISGIVTAVASGSTVIRATVESQTGDATLTVQAASAPPTTTTTTVSVTLDSTSMTVGNTAQGHIVALDSKGNVLSGKTPTWTSLNTSLATVSSTGLVTAKAAGTLSIQGTIDGVKGAAALVVKAPPSSPAPTTASVSVTLDSSSLTVGHTAQATVVAKDASGHVLSGKTPTWTSLTASVAAVTSAGVVTGVAAGTGKIQATVDGIVGSSQLSVTSAPSVPPTPPSSGSGSHPNEPIGFPQLAATSFDSLDGASIAAGTNRANLGIVVDATSPEGSKNVGEMKFPAGFPSGIAPGGFYEHSPFATKPRQVYVSFWIKLSSNWVGQAAGANKILYQNVDEAGRGSIEFLAMGGIDGSEQTLAPMIVPEGVKVSPGAGPSGSPTVALTPNQVPYAASIAYQRGVWGHYEVLMTLNSAPGVADGGIKWWWNGQLYGDYTGHVDWGTVASSGFTEVYWEPTYGGLGAPVPADQYMYMKNLYISGR